MRGDWTVLRDACSPRSAFFHHGVRVAVTVGIAYLLAGRISLHPHWVTVTTLAVLQPYSGATAARAAQRVAGTVLGSFAAVAITMTVRGPLLLAAVMFPLSVAAVATHRRNYRLFTFFLTPVFVLIAERFPGDWWTAAVRAGDAPLGGGIAFIAAVFIFPSRETTRLPDRLATLLDHVADYAVAVLEGLANRHAEAIEPRVADARRDTGISLGEAESSLERLLAEPGHDSNAEGYALQLITYARRSRRRSRRLSKAMWSAHCTRPQRSRAGSNRAQMQPCRICRPTWTSPSRHPGPLAARRGPHFQRGAKRTRPLAHRVVENDRRGSRRAAKPRPRFLVDPTQTTLRPCTSCTTNMISATTRSRCSKPPMVYAVAKPRAHSTSNTTMIVHNMLLLKARGVPVCSEARCGPF